jgi:hypothetical protein
VDHRAGANPEGASRRRRGLDTHLPLPPPPLGLYIYIHDDDLANALCKKPFACIVPLGDCAAGAPLLARRRRQRWRLLLALLLFLLVVVVVVVVVVVLVLVLVLALSRREPLTEIMGPRLCVPRRSARLVRRAFGKLGTTFTTSARRSTSRTRSVSCLFTGRWDEALSNASSAFATSFRKRRAKLIYSCSAP